MKATHIWNRISLGAILAITCWGCTVTSASGTGGATGAGSGGNGGSPAGSGGSGTGTGGASAGCGPAMPTAIAGATPSAAGTAPCDVYSADGGACVAAHSTVRALYSTYNGPLYQVRKTDCTSKDINTLEAGGFANAEEQDTFCGVGACTISVIYDQSPQHNHLLKAPAGMAKVTPGNEANAKALPTMLGGHKVYGLHVVPGVGYRNNAATGTAKGDDAETEYMVVAADYYNGGCCFDYGNMETTSRDDGDGTMEAVYFGSCTIWNKGAGNGPWIMGDLENGLWAGDSSPYAGNPSVDTAAIKFIVGMVKGDVAGSNHWTIKSGNAQTGMLTPLFNGKRPTAGTYNPMRKQGAIGLGTGGDNSNANQGNWFEGVMTAHYSKDAADDKVQANLVSVYGPQ